MDTIEELKYYCSEPEPVGALMLTGEWGCGKTYLLNNSLTHELEDTCVLLRVSLFGMESIEEVKKEVKQCWLRSAVGLNTPTSGLGEMFHKLSETAKTVADKGTEYLPEPWKTILSSVLSSDVIDLVKISPMIRNKKVILIFDDLERTNISTADLLGCINDYCENLHIHTIVVANEAKIESSANDKIKYNEIKEKIIQRTIRHIPEYSSVVSNVINNMVHENDTASQKYKSFLTSNKESIIDIFSGASIDGTTLDQLITKIYSSYSKEELESKKEKIQKLLNHRPHNIRSLKCAIQDFKRIYLLLEEKCVNNKEKWLYSYLSYVLCSRAGLLPESTDYAKLLTEENISVLYPGFYNEKFITDGIRQWVQHGKWTKDTIISEIDYCINRDKAITSEEKVRMNRLLDLEEIDFRDGYPKVLQKAYEGTLDLNDYVNLLSNSYCARVYNIQLPNIKWEKINEGIHRQIEKIIHDKEEPTHYYMNISDETKAHWGPEERDAYKIIEDFLNTNTFMFEKNKSLYVSLIRNEPLNALLQTQNKRFNIFDIEMANATADGFQKTKNIEKTTFVNYFKRMWMTNVCMPDYEMKSLGDGFPTLKQQISQFRDKCHDERLSISEAHASRFLEIIDSVIKKLSEFHNETEEHLPEVQNQSN